MHKIPTISRCLFSVYALGDDNGISWLNRTSMCCHERTMNAVVGFAFRHNLKS